MHLTVTLVGFYSHIVYSRSSVELAELASAAVAFISSRSPSMLTTIDIERGMFGLEIVAVINSYQQLMNFD